MKDGETDNTTDEFEVAKMFRVDTGVRVDLKSVVVVSRVFEETVERVEHFVRQQEEEFSERMLVMTSFGDQHTYLERPP